MSVLLEQMGLRVEAEDADAVTDDVVGAVRAALIKIFEEGATKLRDEFPTLTIRREVF
jgi:hypothetical protein